MRLGWSSGLQAVLGGALGLQSLRRNCGIKSLRAQMLEMGLSSGGLVKVLF